MGRQKIPLECLPTGGKPEMHRRNIFDGQDDPEMPPSRWRAVNDGRRPSTVIATVVSKARHQRARQEAVDGAANAVAVMNDGSEIWSTVTEKSTSSEKTEEANPRQRPRWQLQARPYIA